MRKETSDSRLDRKRGIFFYTGLIISLASVLIAFNYTTYSKINNDSEYEVVVHVPQEYVISTRVYQEEQKPLVTEKLELAFIEKPLSTLIPDKSDENLSIELADLFLKLPDEDKEVVDEMDIVIFTEQMPEYCTGFNSLFNLIRRNIKYPEMERQLGIQGQVEITFVVEPDGSISNVEILRSVSKNIDAEAIRVIQSTNCWIPGKQNGVPRRVRLNMPIKFVLE